MKLGWPPWDCTTDQQRRQMSARVNVEIDLIETAWTNWDNEAWAEYEMFCQSSPADRRRQQIEGAVAAKDGDYLATMNLTEAEQRFLFKLVWPPKRKAQGRPRRIDLDFAVLQVKWVHRVWAKVEGYPQTQRRKHFPSAEDIVIERMKRHGFRVSLEQLASHRKNHTLASSPFAPV